MQSKSCENSACAVASDGAGAAPTSSTLPDPAAGRCSISCNQSQTPPSVCVAHRPHETRLPHPAAARRRRQSVLEPRARHGVHPWLATRARPVAQSLNAFLFIAVMESDGTEVFQPLHGERELMRALDERLRKRSSNPSWGTGTGAAADKVLGRSVASSSLALGVLLPQPRWSKSTTRYRCGLKQRADELWLPAPGPPCMTMTGSPASEPYSSQ